MSKGTAVMVEGLLNPLGSDEDLDVIWNRLVTCQRDKKPFTFKNASGQKHIVPSWALNSVKALFEAELQSPGIPGLAVPRRIQ